MASSATGELAASRPGEGNKAGADQLVRHWCHVCFSRWAGAGGYMGHVLYWFGCDFLQNVQAWHLSTDNTPLTQLDSRLPLRDSVYRVEHDGILDSLVDVRYRRNALIQLRLRSG
jgi:hypothetical protein